MLQTWLLCDVSLLSASHVRSPEICINIWFWQIFKTGSWSSYELWWQVRTQLGHNVLGENVCLKLEKKGKRILRSWGTSIITSTGWRADICVPSREAEGSSEPTNQGPNSSEDIRDCRTGPGTASKRWNNVETEQLKLGPDEYLPTGGMLIPSVLSQQAHMVPCCRRLQQECLFSTRCLQIIYTALYTCCVTMLHRKTQSLSEQSRYSFLLWSRCLYFRWWFSSHNDTDDAWLP